jgi:uncharacterized protein with HEPN domain
LPSDRRISWFEDILDNVARIERFTLGMDFQAFVADEQATFAVLHALLIISEAARRLGADADALAPGQPWRSIRGLGNVLSHEYGGSIQTRSGASSPTTCRCSSVLSSGPWRSCTPNARRSNISFGKWTLLKV